MSVPQKITLDKKSIVAKIIGVVTMLVLPKLNEAIMTRYCLALVFIDDPELQEYFSNSITGVTYIYL